MTSETLFQSPSGTLHLQRYPIPAPTGREQTLRAWDTADEYLLEEVGTDISGLNLAIINDGFGTLTCSLAPLEPAWLVNMSDSFLSQEACRRNLAANRQSLSPALLLLDGMQPLPAPLDLLLIKVPKSLALLEDQLFRLRPYIHTGTRIIAAGMIKHMPGSTQAVFEKVLGPSRTSLARKKARLLFCQPQPADWQGESPYPSNTQLEWQGTNWELTEHANVFSRDSLDIGTRLLLEHLPTDTPEQDIIDLGCGNGLLGLVAAATRPHAHLHFVDESYMAIASASTNFARAFPDRKARFSPTNCLEGVANNSADLILNNPPFHQQHVVGDHIAWQMFKDAKRVLRANGELWVVGNRHLGYHAKLERLFGHCELVASNAKFVVLRATKST